MKSYRAVFFCVPADFTVRGGSIIGVPIQVKASLRSWRFWSCGARNGAALPPKRLTPREQNRQRRRLSEKFLWC